MPATPLARTTRPIDIEVLHIARAVPLVPWRGFLLWVSVVCSVSQGFQLSEQDGQGG